MKKILLFLFLTSLAFAQTGKQPLSPIQKDTVKAIISDSLDVIRTLIGTGGVPLPDSVLFSSDSTDQRIFSDLKYLENTDVFGATHLTFLGDNALNGNTVGIDNTAFGWYSLAANDSGNRNTSYGAYSLMNNMSGEENTAFGKGSLMKNIGKPIVWQTYNIFDGSANTAIGLETLRENLTGWDNTALGAYTMYANVDGNWNTGLGRESLRYNVSGDDNTSVGVQTLFNLTDGNNNVGVGNTALFQVTTGDNNTAVGRDALITTTGSSNTAVGYQALWGLGVGDSNVVLGNMAGWYLGGSNKLVIDNRSRYVVGLTDYQRYSMIYGEFADSTYDQDLYLNANVHIREILTADTTIDAKLVDADSIKINNLQSLHIPFMGTSKLTDSPIFISSGFIYTGAPTIINDTTENASLLLTNARNGSLYQHIRNTGTGSSSASKLMLGGSAIGTPLVELTSFGTNWTQASLTDNTEWGRLRYSGTGKFTFSADNSAASFGFFVNNSEKMTITNTGITVDGDALILVPDTTAITDGYVQKYVGGAIVWSPDISTSGSGLFNPDGVTIDTTAGGLARVLPAKVTKWDSVTSKQDLDADLTDLSDGELTASKVGGVKDADYGDVTVSSGAWAVEDNSHSHTLANVTDLQDSLTDKMNRSEMTGYSTTAHTHTDFFDTLVVTWGVMDTTYAGSLNGWKVPNDITITEISAYTDANTCTFNIEERAETTPNSAGTDVIGSDLVADTDQQETSTFTNATIAKNSWLVPTISATGDVAIFTISVRYIKTD